MTALGTPVYVGRDDVGRIYEGHGMRWYVTECCTASAKGSAGSPTGVCCRACYQPVDAALGGLPPQEQGTPGEQAVTALLARAAVRDRNAAVAALSRIGSGLAPGATVQRAGLGLYLATNPPAQGSGGPQFATHALVFDEYPVRSGIKATGVLVRVTRTNEIVGNLYRGSAVDEQGTRSRHLPPALTDLCRVQAAELLPEVR